MLEEIATHLHRRESFAFETTLAGLAFARQIPTWRAAGYWVELLFLSLPAPELAIARVAERVRQGGHNVPENVIRRRFQAGLDHFHAIYKTLVDAWALFDNSGPEPRILDWGERP